MMNEREAINKTKEWEAAGFKFIGNGSENNDDDPTYCPNCGRDHIFWALFEHPTKTRYTKTDSEYNPLLLNGVNNCLDCGHYWIDEDETEYNDYMQSIQGDIADGPTLGEYLSFPNDEFPGADDH